MKKIAIIGSGVMGLRLADYFASRSLDVVILVRNEIDEKIKKLDDILKKRIKINGEKNYAEVKKRINCTTNWDIIFDCDMVLETVKESIEIKKEIFNKLTNIGNIKDKLIATNTSSLSLEEIRNKCNLAYIIGMHFFNPPIKMQLVEYAISGNISIEIHSILKTFFSICNDKVFLEVPSIPGYIVNRMLFSYLNYCAKYHLDNKIEIKNIDIAMKMGANMPMGPFELCDYIGIDTTLNILQTFYKATNDPIYKPATIFFDLYSKGLLGKKSGKGFYQY